MFFTWSLKVIFSSSVTARNLTVETFIRIESRILISIAFFSGWRLSYMRFYWCWEKVCWHCASYQLLPAPYSQWHGHCKCHCRMQQLLYHQQNEQNASYLRIYTCLWYTEEKVLGPTPNPVEHPCNVWHRETAVFDWDVLFPVTQIRQKQCCMTPLTPLCKSLLINMLWLTVSNAFEKSRYTVMVLCLLSNVE